MQRYLFVAFFLYTTGLTGPVPGALAGGLEYAGGGTSALGRGGANAARADSPLVLANNPAGLAELRGVQMVLNMDMAVMDACVTPTGYYGWGAYARGGEAELTDPATGEKAILNLGARGDLAAEAYYSDPYDQVCMDSRLTPVPQMAFSMRLSERLGFGAGLIFPAISPQGVWGSADGVIRGDTGELRPAATRYMLLESNNLGIFPTVGIGYRVADWLRIGAALEWGMFSINNTQMSPLKSGTNLKEDMIARVAAEDFFVPAATASVHIVPMDALDIVFGARIQDDIDAEGRLEVTSGVFDPNLQRYTTKGLQVVSVQQSFPWKLWGAMRFARRLRSRPTGTGDDEGEVGPSSEPLHDAFGDELWDIELDVVYEMNSRVQALDVDFAPFQQIDFLKTDGTFTAPTAFPLPQTPPVHVSKKWKDQVSVRLGGSFNIVPGVLGINAGAHYENRGVDPSFMQLDFWPVQRLGIHAGLSLRIAGGVDLSLAYAHIFQETIVVGVPQHDATGAQGIDKGIGPKPDNFTDPPTLEEPTLTEEVDGIAAYRQAVTQTQASANPVIVNAGKYESSIDVISAGIQMHF